MNDSMAERIEQRLAAVEVKVDAIEKTLAEILTTVKILKWVGGVGSTLLVAVALFAAPLWVREIARQVIREEFAHYATTVQPGKLKAANREPGAPRAYVWKLAAPIAAGNLLLMTAELITPMPGVAVSAELVEDGAACRITLHGDAAALEGLREPLDAKVTLTARR
jgi:hypothetical protein